MAERFEFAWEREAMQGNELPEGLDLPSQMAYISLRGIYAQYHAKMISRDQAAAEKGKIRREYEHLEKEWAFGEKLATQRAAICAALSWQKPPAEPTQRRRTRSGFAMCWTDWRGNLCH